MTAEGDQSNLELPSPRTTIAVLIGASKYPRKSAWSNPVLGRSAQAFRGYLLSPRGLMLGPQQVCDLFDADVDPTVQLLRIGNFLANRTKSAHDLIVYYVGHGGFHGDEYHLGVRATQQDFEFITAIESRKLAQIIRKCFPRKRIYVILDSCFSASAANDFQADLIEAAVRKMAQPLPRQGVAFLAAASRYDVTRAPRTERYTIFTGAILEALKRGIDGSQSGLSLYELYEKVSELLRHRDCDEGGRPELHLPRQSDGDVSLLRVFPNTAYPRAETKSQREPAAARSDPGYVHCSSIEDYWF